MTKSALLKIKTRTKPKQPKKTQDFWLEIIVKIHPVTDWISLDCNLLYKDIKKKKIRLENLRCQ